MSFLPLNTILGKLQIVEVLDWYDGPRLFIAENAAGNRYVAFWANEDDEASFWLYAAASEKRINALATGKIEIRHIYTEPEDELVLLVRISHENLASVNVISPQTIEEDLLPPHGDFLTNEEAIESKTNALDISKIYIKGKVE